MRCLRKAMSGRGCKHFSRKKARIGGSEPLYRMQSMRSTHLSEKCNIPFKEEDRIKAGANLGRAL